MANNFKQQIFPFLSRVLFFRSKATVLSINLLKITHVPILTFNYLLLHGNYASDWVSRKLMNAFRGWWKSGFYRWLFEELLFILMTLVVNWIILILKPFQPYKQKALLQVVIMTVSIIGTVNSPFHWLWLASSQDLLSLELHTYGDIRSDHQHV